MSARRPPDVLGWGLVAGSSVAISRLIEHGRQVERDVPEWAHVLREALLLQIEERRRGGKEGLVVA